MAGAGTTLTQQTFLSGINRFIEAITDPERSAKGFFNGLIGSVIPTIVSDIAKGTDPFERRIESPMDALKARVPGARRTLEPRVNTLGQKVKAPDFLTVMLDPSRPSKASSDSAVQELVRLTKAGYPSVPTQLGKKKTGYDSLTPEQNTKIWLQSGTMIRRKIKGLLTMPQYQAASDEAKAKTIKKVTQDVNNMVRAAMLLELTQGLTGKDLMRELSKHKKSGLITQTVLDIYNASR
jgi:hypothetical protein